MVSFSSFKTSWHFETARWAWTLRLSLLSVLIGLLLWFAGLGTSPGFYGRMEADFLDGLTQWQVKRPHALQADHRITIIDIDEASLEAFGSWPWPRSLTAQLIEQTMHHYQAKALGLDIVFPDTTQPAHDRALQHALRTPGVVLAQAFDLNPMGEPPQSGYLAGGFPVSNSHASLPSVLATGYVANHSTLVQSLVKTKQPLCVGHITPSPSQDGVVRHIAPWVRYDDQVYPMLALSLMRCAKDAPKNGAAYGASQSVLYLEKFNQWRMVWPRSIASYTVVSAKDVLSRQIDTDLLKDRYVLVGSSALGIGDRVATPLAPWLPGVMVHAQILSFILDHRAAFESQDVASLSLGGDARWVAWLYTVVLGALICWTLFRSHLLGALLVAIGGSLVWLMVALALHQAYWFSAWILPWAMVFFWSVFYVPMEWGIVQAKHQIKMRRLGAYLAPTVLKRLLSEDRTANLTPKRATITVLFVDVANYTALSETLSPEVLTSLTQAILSELTQAVHAQAGTLDKYMGDAVMALWGAPLEQSDHADRAIACALDMQQRITQRNRDWQLQYGLADAIAVRIGINTGEVVVGEMGSDIRRTYTAIGDAVNVAARLQEQAKIWQHPILLGQACAQAAQAHAVILLGPLTLRGKHHPEMIYSLAQFDRPLMVNE